MLALTEDFIRDRVADSQTIYQRGERLFEAGAYCCTEADREKGAYLYEVDGRYGDYTIAVQFSNGDLHYSCSCPYPGDGCKHTVAVLLDIMDRMAFRGKDVAKPQVTSLDTQPSEPWLNADEIRLQAVEDRKKRAKTETFNFVLGEMYKGEHLVETTRGLQYKVTLHNPESGLGHCDCPDFLTNRLGTCKHLVALTDHIGKQKDLQKRLKAERFPFGDIYWDSVHEKPRLFWDHPREEIEDVAALIEEHFDAEGLFRRSDLAEFLSVLHGLKGNKRFRIQEAVLERLDGHVTDQQLRELAGNGFPSLRNIRATLYPYQEEGVRFALFRKGALIGDEMGLGKTLQAIVLGVLKKEVFGFKRILVVTLASLKEQWKREIERFTDEKAIVVAGGRERRHAAYCEPESLFKITNYEAVLRDVTFLCRLKPDLVILDEAQRIKNFATKTAEAVKSIPRKHSMILTGTPLENKLEDVYSIVQFLDPHLLAPLWKFAADHFMLSRDKKGKILGYRNLDKLHERIKGIVIRRRKEEVLSDLPEEIVNNYYVDLHEKQAEMHNGYLASLLPLINKKFLTPMDIRRIQELLLKMRMACDSTYLIDRSTNLSPKLKELDGILDELIIQNKRKVVIFSEWTTMTFLIGKQLSRASIPFVELSGKVPVNKRQSLIDEFTTNPECRVFLSTDAGGTGLNLQAADCVINFELPWNPARLNQRIGRVNRIGQASKCVNVVNLIAKNSLEEKIFAGIQLKLNVFEGVFDGGPDMVEFSTKKRAEVLNNLREMMGEAPILLAFEQRPAEELPEDTPFYLNPEVLKDRPDGIAYDAEETEPFVGWGEPGEPQQPDGIVCDTEEMQPHQAREEGELSLLSEEGGRADSELAHQTAEERASSLPDHAPADSALRQGGESESARQAQSPERLEQVMNSGLQFISGLLEMATGQKLSPLADGDSMIRVDRNTGEVTMKFKLPGF
jgi:superfamily II DNA or RNA helicase